MRSSWVSVSPQTLQVQLAFLRPPSALWRRLNRTAFSSVAEKRRTGIEISPKLIAPRQIACIPLLSGNRENRKSRVVAAPLQLRLRDEWNDAVETGDLEQPQNRPARAGDRKLAAAFAHASKRSEHRAESCGVAELETAHVEDELHDLGRAERLQRLPEVRDRREVTRPVQMDDALGPVSFDANSEVRHRLPTFSRTTAGRMPPSRK